MHQTLDELTAFYASPMGRRVRALLAGHIHERWPSVRGLTVMGLGYATPYLPPFLGEAAQVGALMPGGQGYARWPASGPVRTIAVEDDALPLPDTSVDRLLAVHAIEMSDAVKRTLREIWRVLRPEGRALIIVPNRRSIWAHRDGTPFGEGQPFSKGQLEGLVGGGLFQIVYRGYALATPPVRMAALWQYAQATERIGLRFWPAVSGAIVLEVSKQVTATIPRGKAEAVRARWRPAMAVPAQGTNRKSPRVNSLPNALDPATIDATRTAPLSVPSPSAS